MTVYAARSSGYDSPCYTVEDENGIFVLQIASKKLNIISFFCPREINSVSELMAVVTSYKSSRVCDALYAHNYILNPNARNNIFLTEIAATRINIEGNLSLLFLQLSTLSDYYKEGDTEGIMNAGVHHAKILSSKINIPQVHMEPVFEPVPFALSTVERMMENVMNVVMTFPCICGEDTHHSFTDRYVCDSCSHTTFEVNIGKKSDFKLYSDELRQRAYLRKSVLRRITDMFAIILNVHPSYKLCFPGDGIGIGAMVATCLGRKYVSGDTSQYFLNIAKQLNVQVAHETFTQTINKAELRDVVVVSHLLYADNELLSKITSYNYIVFEHNTIYKGMSRLLQVKHDMRYLRVSNTSFWLGKPFKLTLETRQREIPASWTDFNNSDSQYIITEQKILKDLAYHMRITPSLKVKICIPGFDVQLCTEITSVLGLSPTNDSEAYTNLFYDDILKEYPGLNVSRHYSMRYGAYFPYLQVNVLKPIRNEVYKFSKYALISMKNVRAVLPNIKLITNLHTEECYVFLKPVDIRYSNRKLKTIITVNVLMKTAVATKRSQRRMSANVLDEFKSFFSTPHTFDEGIAKFTKENYISYSSLVAQYLHENLDGRFMLKTKVYLDHYHMGLALGKRVRHLHECEECGSPFEHEHMIKTYEESLRYPQMCEECLKMSV